MEYTHEQILEKVEQLKSSVTVSGVFLIKSNKFTEEFYAKFCSEAKEKLGITNINDVKHLTNAARTWTDEEIYQQIKTMLHQKYLSDSELENHYQQFFKTLKFENYENDVQLLRDYFTELFEWNGLVPLNPDFWARFASAPYFIMPTHNQKLVEAKELYGACGMREIFDDSFENSGYTKAYYINNKIYSFKQDWLSQAEIIKEKATIYSSPYKNLEDFQENVTIKNSTKEAKNFYMDKTKNINDRITIFNEFGEKDSCIHTPHNVGLRRMFDMYTENGWCERHEIIHCTNILEYWLENLEDYRCSLDWSNKYHPKLVKKMRNYKPSKVAIERLRNYYLEQLFLEGIAKFEFDW